MGGEAWVDYYQLLGISSGASTKEIASAYRAQALRWHPDKNVGDPQASGRFHQLTRAYQVLVDGEARRAFDAVLAGRRAQRERDQHLDSQRRTMRDDLLRREREARQRRMEQEEAERRLAQEIDRVRREGAAARGRDGLGDEDAASPRLRPSGTGTASRDTAGEESTLQRPPNYESDVLARMRQVGKRQATKP